MCKCGCATDGVVGCCSLRDVLDVECWMLDAGCWGANVESWMIIVGCWMLDVSKCRLRR